MIDGLFEDSTCGGTFCDEEKVCVVESFYKTYKTVDDGFRVWLCQGCAFVAVAKGDGEGGAIEIEDVSVGDVWGCWFECMPAWGGAKEKSIDGHFGEGA